MHCRLFVYLITLTALSLAAEQRKLHRLVGGHLRIINPDSDDSELVITSASGSREKKKNQDDGGGDEKKTLSQQVADGKYGLIQKELFLKPPKRPGILSYEPNPEVPKDNINTLGGLSKNEIWLAENHLLVIKGGTYPPYDDKRDGDGSIWPPIDEYSAPLHQVKIPKHPKVPPPFPVQLTEDGPLQILGTNTTRTLNDTAEASAYAVPPPGGWEPGDGPFFPTPSEQEPPDTNQAYPVTGQIEMRIPGQNPGEYEGGVPFPPFPTLNGTWPPYFASLPPGATILTPPPPPGNQTQDFYDEDDPSIYYPPPYSFFYPKDNSSAVPPGPLVPGIILPPPPNFFAPLDEEMTTTTTIKPPQRQRKPPAITTTTTHSNAIIRPTTSSAPVTRITPIRTKTTKKTTVKFVTARYPTYTKENIAKTTVSTTIQPKTISVLPQVRVQQPNRTYLPPQRTVKPPTYNKKPTVTILRPVKPSTVTPKIYVNNNEVNDDKRYEVNDNNRYTVNDNNRYEVSDAPKSRKTTVSSTQVPLKYFTTSNEIDSNSVTQLPEKFSIGTYSNTRKPIHKPQSQYYFYEEEQNGNSVTTPLPSTNQNGYYDIPKRYYLPVKQVVPVAHKPQYVYVTAKPYNTPKPRYRFVQQPQIKPPQNNAGSNSFSIHIAKLQKQIHQYYTTPKTVHRQPQPVYQYSFQANNYQSRKNAFKPSPQLDNGDHFKPIPKYSVQIQQAIEIIPQTEAPSYAVTPQNYNRPEQNNQYLEQYYSTPKPYQQHETATSRYITTPTPITQYSYEATPNPIYQGYYTKPDEGYFDDNTKQYFTMFGRKLPSATTPIPSTTSRPSNVYKKETTPPYRQPPPYRNEQNPARQQYQRPISLESDIQVNYVNPRPGINPHAELIPVNGQNYRQKPVQYVRAQTPQHDIRENQDGTRAEIIKAVPIEVPTSDGDRQSSYISYQLPGDDGAHFYFLTPQLAQEREQGADYYYSQPSGSRLRREQRNSNKSNGRDR